MGGWAHLVDGGVVGLAGHLVGRDGELLAAFGEEACGAGVVGGWVGRYIVWFFGFRMSCCWTLWVGESGDLPGLLNDPIPPPLPPPPP